MLDSALGCEYAMQHTFYYISHHHPPCETKMFTLRRFSLNNVYAIS